MKINVETKTITEIDVNFPCYKKFGTSLYKVTEDRNMIEVNDHKYDNSFGIRIGKLAYFEIVIKDGDNITEQQYNEAFIDVMKRIEKMSPVSELFEENFKDHSKRLKSIDALYNGKRDF